MKTKTLSKMKRATCLTVLAAISFLLISLSTLAQWYPQTSGTNEDLKSVCFTDTLHGWVSGSNGIILHTNDGGDFWEEQTSVTNINLAGVCFTDSFNGCAVGGSYSWPYLPGVILTTSDGGDNWEEVDFPDLSTRNDVFFIDVLKGWAVGHYGILHTSNGGETWETQLEFEHNLYNVSFTDSLNGWASGGFGVGSTGSFHSYILHTCDGGNSWDYQFEYSSRYGYILYDICFTDSLKGWSTGGGYWDQNGIVLKTIDGGNNWDTSYLHLGSNAVLNSVSFADSFNGLAVGQGGIIISTSDGGNTWDTIPSGTVQDLNDVYFTENGYGWAVGDSGTILHADYSQTVGLEEFGPESFRGSLEFKVDCYPNPFSSSTTFEFELNEPGSIELKIFNQLGELIEVIQSSIQPGKHSISWDASNLPSGIYFIRLRFDNELMTRKMVKL